MKTGDPWTIPEPTLLDASAGYPAQPTHSALPETTDRSRILLWAALVTDHPELQSLNEEEIRVTLIKWWGNFAEEVLRMLTCIPGPFRTTRFKGEIRPIETTLSLLKPAFESLAASECSFQETIEHLGRSFRWDKERWLQWKLRTENLATFFAWQPSFLSARRYIMAALPLRREEIDRLRDSLLQMIDEPHDFLKDSTRRTFDEKFAEFKKSYTETYYALHEEALCLKDRTNGEDAKIDPVSLKNLDLLSNLQHVDKRFLNRVKILGNWVQKNQCRMPLRQILEKYPRCYCNFNPCSRRQPADAAALINQAVQEGIEYFRTRLRRCGHWIMAELQSSPPDDNTLQTVRALLGDGPMPPLRTQTIKALNRVIGKYPNEFLAEFRRK